MLVVAGHGVGLLRPAASPGTTRSATQLRHDVPEASAPWPL